MQTAGPPLTVIEWPGVGHAPALMDGPQITAVADWLATTTK